jgi:hypothetical protein
MILKFTARLSHLVADKILRFSHILITCTEIGK